MGHPSWSGRLRGDELAGLMGPVIGGCYDVSEWLGKLGIPPWERFPTATCQHDSGAVKNRPHGPISGVRFS